MKRHKVIKTDKGRVTIQTNSFGIPEIKVRVGEKTHILSCEYNRIKDIERVVMALLESKVKVVMQSEPTNGCRKERKYYVKYGYINYNILTFYLHLKTYL